MGLFHDVCVNCGNRVPKKARVCSKCGRGAPNAWTKCPACKKWVDNASEYCPNCNHPLHPAERIDLAGGVWDREAGLFAQRFELGDVGRILDEGLMLQEGTLAVLLDRGRETKVLGSGRHTPEGTLRSLNWFGNPPPRSAVLVESGDVVFRVDFTGRRADGQEGPTGTPLRSAEEQQVRVVAEITLRFAPAKAVAFLENFMKEKRSISTKDVCAWLFEEGLSAVRDLCRQSTIEDLVKDPDRRPRLEEALEQALAEPLMRCGLRLVRVGAVEFYGKAYEEMRARYGELDRARRLLEFGKKQLELLAEQEQMEFCRRVDESGLAERAKHADEVTTARAKWAAEMVDYLVQLAQEKQLTESERSREMRIAELLANGEVSLELALQEAARALERHAKEMRALADKLELDLTLDNYDRQKALADARLMAELAAPKSRVIGLDAVIEGKKSPDTSFGGPETCDEPFILHGMLPHFHPKVVQWLNAQCKNETPEERAFRMDKLVLLVGRHMRGRDVLVNDPEAWSFLKRAIEEVKIVPKRKLEMTSEQVLPAIPLADPAQLMKDMERLVHDALAAKQVLAEVKAAEESRPKHDKKLEEQVIDLAKTAVEHQNTIVVPGQSNIVH